MSVPVITQPPAYFGGLQVGVPAPGLSFIATNTPISWSLNGGGPPGCAISTTGGTGNLSGTPTNSGVYTANITATNGSGASAPAVMTFGVLPAGSGNALSGIGPSRIDINLQDGSVSRPGAAATDPIVVGKMADLPYLLIAFIGEDGKTPQNLSIASLTVALLQPDSDPGVPIPINDGNATQTTDVDGIAYLTKLDLTTAIAGTALGDALSGNSTNDLYDTYDFQAEIKWVTMIAPATGYSPDTLPRRSQFFTFRLLRNIIS